MRETSPRTLCSALCLLVLGAFPCFGQSDSFQASRAGETWTLSTAANIADTARLETPTGHTLRLALPPGAEISSLVALDDGDDGWALAGSVDAADGRRRLFLMTGGAEGAPRSLPEPPAQTGRERRFPVLLAEDGHLAGLVWLEGDNVQSFGVHAAAFAGRRFRAPETVSPPGPGSQMGLTGAVLADGSWLLAWSAYDGEDTGIVWSRRLGGNWLPVHAVSAAENRVPDITSALTATDHGALLAWSRYEEDGYRLRLARFEGGEWRGEEAAGPAGSLYPSWSGGPDRPRLLYFTAAPRGWAAAEFDGSGKIVRQAATTAGMAPYPERPVISDGAGSAGEMELRWPNRDRQAVAPWKTPWKVLP